MEKIKWLEKVTNEEFLEGIGEERAFLNTTLLRKANWNRYILRSALGQLTEVKGVGKRRFDDLRKRRRYCEVKSNLKIEKDGYGSWEKDTSYLPQTD